MNGIPIIKIRTNEQNRRSKEALKYARPLIRKDGAGYPSMHGLELCVTSRATQATNNDDEMCQSHRQHEC